MRTPENEITTRLVSNCQARSLFFCALAIVIPFLTLIGWWLDILLLRQLHPSLPAMQANTACGLIVGAAGIMCLRFARRSPICPVVALVCGLSVFLIGALTLIQYIFGLDFGIDHIFVGEAASASNPYPGRPSPQTSGNFVLLGFGIILYIFRYCVPGQFCAILMMANAFIAVTGYIFGASQLYGFPLNVAATGMAVHTATVFLLLAMALICTHPYIGIMRLFSSDSRSGRMARQIFLTLILAPPIAGGITRIGVNMGWYGVSAQASIFTIIIIGVSFWKTWQASIQAEQEELLARHAVERLQNTLTELKLSEEKFSGIISSSADAIIFIDEDQKITLFNDSAETVFGYSREEVLGQTLDILMPARFRMKHQQHVKDFIAGPDGSRAMGERKKEICGLRKNGEEFPVAATIIKHTVHDRKILAVNLQDITKRKKAEKRLLEYAEKLRLTNQDLDDFVYIVSHDLKEPLRGLYSYSQFLQEDYKDKLDEAGQEKLNTIKKLASLMTELINNLLHYSRVGRRELAFAATDLNEVLEKTCELIKTAYKDENVTIKVKENLPTIICDQARIGEVFYNLMANAIKYNDSKKKRVEVGHVRDCKGYKGKDVFYVADNGIGIDEKYRKTVFKIFKRLHARDRYGGGTGSGLAIVKKIIERHGGDIWVVGNDMNGSTFYFTLRDHGTGTKSEST